MLDCAAAWEDGPVTMTGPRQDIVGLVTTTLQAHGYVPTLTRRLPYALLLIYEFLDDFGGVVRYSIALVEGQLGDPELKAVRKIAAKHESHLVIVGPPQASVPEPALSVDEFMARFGGGIASLLPLDPAYPKRLEELGRNQLPIELSGRPDQLFEHYVYAGLQFITGTRVIRYGQERRGDSVPDGLILLRGRYVLYDAKSAADGFVIDSDTMRQCAAYIEDFACRYKDILGRPYAFLLVSGSFAQPPEVLTRRSRELYSRSEVPLTCLDVPTMISAVTKFLIHPRLRSVIDWRSVLVGPLITPDCIQRAAEAASRDKIRGGESTWALR